MIGSQLPLHAPCGTTLHPGVFHHKPSPPLESDGTPLMELHAHFKASQIINVLSELRTASLEVCLPFGVLTRGKPLVPSLPHSATCTHRLSQPRGALFLPRAIRSCFIPEPPLGFLRLCPRCSHMEPSEDRPCHALDGSGVTPPRLIHGSRSIGACIGISPESSLPEG